MAPCAEPGVEAAITRRQESEPRKVRAAVAFGMEPVEGDRARFGMDQAGRDSQQRRLPGAVRAADRDERTSRNGKVDAVENGLLAPALVDAVQDEQVAGRGGDAADACDSGRSVDLNAPTSLLDQSCASSTRPSSCSRTQNS